MTSPVRKALTFISLGLAAVAATAEQPHPNALPMAELQALAAAYGVVKESFVTPTTGATLIKAAIHGMLREIDPEGGAYYTAEERKALMAESSRGTAGVGAQLWMRGDQFVLAPIVGGPAEAAGVRPGDLLRAVDQVPLQGMGQFQVVQLLGGAAGSKVRLSVLRDCSQVPFEIEIERKLNTLPPIHMSRPSPELAVLRIPSFRDRALEEIASSLSREWRAQPFKGLVLDLRRNPGGLVEHAVGLAAIFLQTDAVVAKSVGKSPAANQVFRASAGQYSRSGRRDPLAEIPKELRELPLVVLVDEGTSSGSEIVVAALKDHQRATIVGRRTFGRGSIQTLTTMPDGGAIKYTSAYWESPLGARIHGVGVQPHELLEHADEQRELDAALASLKKRL
jgi:carboxyl-terminal processing protease